MGSVRWIYETDNVRHVSEELAAKQIAGPWLKNPNKTPSRGKHLPDANAPARGPCTGFKGGAGLFAVALGMEGLGPVADPDAVTTSLFLHTCYPGILLMHNQGTTA